MLTYNPRAIKESRVRAGLTQKEVAIALRVKPQRIQQLESEGASWPTVATLLKVWEVLNVTDPTPFFVDNHSGMTEVNDLYVYDNRV
ncbi:MAG: helix-turn-helix transcriptional regulator [Desulfatibacillum sp.]|nr:helix-turn-helix transcriptional regulator [Desulfatibacillum sp.]